MRPDLTNFFLGSAPGHPFWRFAAGLLPSRATMEVMSATGPFFLNFAWNQYTRKAERAGCLQAVEASAHIFQFAAWQRTVGAHHYSGTWHHNGTAAHDPKFEAWFGVNRSNNCAEADYSRFIRATWQCRKGKYRCPRPTWERFDAECNGTKAECPEKRRGLEKRREKRRVWVGRPTRARDDGGTQNGKRCAARAKTGRCVAYV